MKRSAAFLAASASAALFFLGAAAAAPPAPASGVSGSTSEIVRTAALLTLLSLLPAFLVCATSFTRIVIVLSMIRHGFGMPETPPNAVLVSLALFLTAFVMQPTLTAVSRDAMTPFLSGRLALEPALERGAGPLRAFMIKEVRESDLDAVYAMDGKPAPATIEDVDTMHLTLAFMLNELRAAFRIGFVVLLPFLLIDLVVSSVLLALGMLMVPPSTISLPIKILMFVLIDGWNLVLFGLAGSFQ